MQQTNLFFSPIVDLQRHALPEPAKQALQILYAAGCVVNQPAQFGPAIETILIDAVHQDYDSPLHPPALQYDPDTRSLEAAVRVDLDRLLTCSLPEAVALYQELIFQVLDQIEDQVEGYDFDGLKRAMEGAIGEEVKVME